MSALSRRKGRAFEREVAKQLEPVFPLARPNLAQSRGTRRDGPDIVGTHLWIECYHGKSNAMEAKWQQAVRDCAASAVLYSGPVVVAKRDRQTPVVLTWATALGLPDCPEGTRLMLSLADWVRLLAHRAELKARQVQP